MVVFLHVSFLIGLTETLNSVLSFQALLYIYGFCSLFFSGLSLALYDSHSLRCALTPYFLSHALLVVSLFFFLVYGFSFGPISFSFCYLFNSSVMP